MNQSDHISKNFTWQEMTVTHTGIPNNPPKAEKKNIEWFVNTFLQPFRDWLGLPIIIDSAYRNQEVNEAVGGSPTSEHRFLNGGAVDIVIGSYMPSQIAQKLEEAWHQGVILFDQIIIYPTHCHWGVKKDINKNRFEIKNSY